MSVAVKKNIKPEVWPLYVILLYLQTPMNQASTRSHCIFTIHISSRVPGSATIRRSKLHLVDLAGYVTFIQPLFDIKNKYFTVLMIYFNIGIGR